MAKTTITNLTKGPKGVNTPDGVVYIEGGQSAEVELTDGELASAKETGHFEFGAAAAKRAEKAAADDGKAE